MEKIVPRQNLLPPSKYHLKCPWEFEEADRIIVHNTANDAPAENEIAYMIGNNEATSYHFAVDGGGVVQGIPLDKGTFSCANRYGDTHGISVEICYSLSGGPRFTAAEQMAARFIAQLLTERGWGIEKVTKHQDYDGKYCPHRTLDLGWGRFLSMVDKYRNEEKEDDEMLSYEQWKEYQERYEREQGAKPVSGWAVGFVKRVGAAGIMVGDKNGGFRPRSPIERQEAAVVIAKAIDVAVDTAVKRLKE